MNENDLINFMYILLFLAGGCITVFIPFVISYFIRPKTIEYQKSFQPYECGVDPFKQMWDYRFGISYYLYALISWHLLLMFSIFSLLEQFITQIK